MLRFLPALLLLIPLAVNADTRPQNYAPGDTIAPITLKDQHDKTGAIDETTRVILYATGMPAGKVARAAIDPEDANFLPEHNAVFLSNISGMPALIAKLFAIPKMRKHPYSILLDRSGKASEKFPSEQGKVTVIRLDRLKIRAITLTRDALLIKKIIAAAGEQ